MRRFSWGCLSASGEASAELTSRMAHAIRLDKAERAQPVLRPEPDRRQGAGGRKIGGTARSVGVPIFCMEAGALARHHNPC